MSWLSKRFDHLLFEEYRVSVHFLGVFRILFCLGILLVTGLRNSAWMSGSSNYLFIPPFSVAIFFDHIPSLPWLVGLDALTWISILCLLFGFKTAYASVATSILLIVQGSFLYSLGKVDHDILYVLLPLALAGSKWGTVYSIDASLVGSGDKSHRQEYQSWPVAIVSLLLCFGMFTSGFQKLTGGWLMLDSPAVHAHLVKNFFVGRRTDFLAETSLYLNSATLWEIGDWVTVFFELGFSTAFFHRRLLRFFLLAAVFFHLANFLMLNILYETNFLVYLLFVPATVLTCKGPITERLLSWFGSKTKLVVTVLVMGLWYILVQYIGDTELRAYPSLTNFVGYLTDHSGRYVTAYTVIALTTFVLFRVAGQAIGPTSGTLRQATT